MLYIKWMSLLCCCRRRRLSVPSPRLHIYQGDDNEVQHGLQRIVQLEYWFLSPDKSPLMHFSYDGWVVRAVFVGQLVVRHLICYLFRRFLRSITHLYTAVTRPTPAVCLSVGTCERFIAL